jgi:hypothetical protein
LQASKSNIQAAPSFFSKTSKTLKESLSSNIYRIFLKGIIYLSIIILLLPIDSASGQITFHRRDSIKTKHLWLLAQVVPGSGQIINKQYWKVPAFYAGMGGMLYMGINANKSYQRYKADFDNLNPASIARESYEVRYTKAKYTRNLYYAGVGAFYIASVADALLVYNRNTHSPVAATILSTVLPGMGQVYNKKYWKVPIVYGGLSTLYFLVNWNNRGYIRFKDAISKWPLDEFHGQRTKDELGLYRDIYRKNRDVSFVALVAFYALNVIDANVDANLYDWNVNDDLAVRIEPTIINNFASTVYTEPAFGLSCRINF